jgi:hypothetical protein
LVFAPPTPSQLYALLVTGAGRELGRIEAGEFRSLARALASIAGPVELPSGTGDPVRIAVDGVLASLAAPFEPLTAGPSISCLGRLEADAYACTPDGIQRLEAFGPSRELFALRTLSAPDAQLLEEPQRSLCESQWLHFRSDLSRLGLLNAEPVVELESERDAGWDAFRDAAAAPMPSFGGEAVGGEHSQPTGCASAGVLARRSAGWLDGGVWFGCVVLARRRRAQGRCHSPWSAAPIAAGVVRSSKARRSR